ncbi:MAG: RdgB/HAM1 family non-canonical purine NTP pyrophosphatase [Bacteroidota bacterium]|nr:RdgB/HAM1 family non-canonical purine NTP pyrophosphatase [Bacteroidota bacterium]
MNEIILASNNENKLREFRQIFLSKKIISLDDINFNREIDETGTTLKQNALIKVREVFNYSNKICISDDSGLEIDYLNGEPGVYSARYAGNYASSIDNIKKVLNNLGEAKNRRARFKTVIAYKDSLTEAVFEGEINGNITKNIRGEGGFGYDPIFIPNNFNITFSEMKPEQKNKISHRSLAINKLFKFLYKK